VHNGIIENFRELRAELARAGFGHETDTDTETVALLTRHHMAEGMSPEDAYVLSSLAGDLKISEVVDMPHYLVSMHMPKSVLAGGS